MVRLMVLSLLLVLPGCKNSDEAAKAGPTPAKHPISADGALHPSPEDRCPVCGMVPKKPKFASGVELKDGTSFYTCGPNCMLRAQLHPEQHLGVKREQIKRLVVPDYFMGKHIDAKTAWWIAGSDVKGAMGQVIVPVASEADVATFKKRHGGSKVFQLKDLDDALFKKITGMSGKMDPKSGQ